MADTSKELSVERAYSKLHVPLEQGKYVYAYPAFGPCTYTNVGKQILQAGLAVSTGDAIAPLVHAAYCRPSQYQEFSDVANTINNRWLCVFNQDLWTSKGLYVIQDTKAQGLSNIHTVKSLEKRLKDAKELSWGGIRFSKDGSVRFAPKGSYTLGEHTPQTLAKDGAVIAQYDIRGAELLGEVIEVIKKPAITYCLEIRKDQRPVQRVSALVEGDVALHLCGHFDNGDGSSGFGVFESCASGAQKNQ